MKRQQNLIKIKMPFEMFDQQKAEVEAGRLFFPCQMEILCEINMGGQNKAVLTALSMKLDAEPGKPEGKPVEDKPKLSSAQTAQTQANTNK